MFPLFGQRLTILFLFFFSINKPGGCAKITKIHFAAADGSNIEALDVKYILGGSEKNIDPAIVSPYETLQRGGRKRRGREFLLEQVREQAAIALTSPCKKNMTLCLKHYHSNLGPQHFSSL